ncbi:MAG TPA: hypothetical protein VF753_03300 [Terriglobales bacterium]
MARAIGPPLTSFDPNQGTYIFELTSSSGSQVAILSYKFFDYEPELPPRVFDYSRLYTLEAAPDPRCEESIEQISKRVMFNNSNTFVGIKYELDYSKNVPPLNLPQNTRLPCYVLSQQGVHSIR